MVLKWIAAVALFAFATALALFALTPARLLAAHVIFALGLLPLILAAMGFFVPVLTRSRAPEPAIRLLPVAALAGGLLVVLHFAAPAALARVDLVAVALSAIVVLLLGWLWRRARGAIGPAHPGLVTDGGLTAVKLGHRCRRTAVTYVSRIRLDAVLHDWPKPQPSSKRGPKPK